jgi:hypothetical protein
VKLFGQIIKNMLENIKMIKSTEKVFSVGEMANNMKENGLMESNM